MTPESSVLEGGGGANVHALMWQALRGIELPGALDASAGAAGSGDDGEGLPFLWETMWRAANGEELDVSSLGPALRAPRLLAAVRRSFLDLVISLEDRVDVHQILRVLRAIDHVEDALERARLESPCPPTQDATAAMAELAHDLRSPLSSVVFLVDGLRRERSGPLTEAQRRELGLVYSAAHTLSALADDIVALGRGADGLLGAPGPFCLSDIVGRTLDVVRPMVGEGGPELRVSLPERDCRVGHPVALSRVLLNLIGNAVRHTEHGYVEVAITEPTETRVRLAVRDTGPGLPAEVRARLARTGGGGASEATSAGNGLGLVISRKLVAAMGGDLAVETPADGGTRFSFELDLPLAL